MEENNHQEKMEVSHQPVPGYKPIFFITITGSVLYLGYIILSSIL